MAENKQIFAGDKKVGKSILTGIENRFKYWAVPRLPKQVETYHLTMTTLLWSAGNIWLGFMARENLAYLWGVSAMIILQYITDLFDGEVGRQRNTGLIKWGFYMDHFLDYVFLSSLVFVGYAISPKGLEIWYFGLAIIMGAFMVNSFLSFAATNEFEIYRYGIGPTEIRVVFIAINTFIIYFGTGKFNMLLPAVVVLCLSGLAINTYQIHAKLWAYDIAKKSQSEQ